MKRLLLVLVVVAVATVQAWAADPRDCTVEVSRKISRDSYSVGTGTVVSSEGGKSVIVTNAHVVASGIAEPTIRRGAKVYTAKVLAVELSESPDLAILQVDTDLPAATIATGLPEPGEELSTCGFGGSGPGGSPNVKKGVAVEVREYGGLPTLVSTVLIVSGDSGSGLFNKKGELVGVAHSRELARRGGGFVPAGQSWAVPVNEMAVWVSVKVESKAFPRLHAVASRFLPTGKKPAEKALASYASVVARVKSGETVYAAHGVTRRGFVTIDPATSPAELKVGLWRCFMGEDGPMMVRVTDAATAPIGILQRPVCQGGNCPILR